MGLFTSAPLQPVTMLIPKKTRKEVYRYLFKEGVLVAKKDHTLPKHPHIPSAKNAYVIEMMRSIVSKGFVKQTVSWQWYYWYLTNEGIEYLRDYLHLSEEVVPATLKKSSRPASRGVERGEGRSGGKGGWGDGGKGGDRDGSYRRGAFGDKPEGGFGGGKGGFGRGGGAPAGQTGF